MCYAIDLGNTKFLLSLGGGVGGIVVGGGVGGVVVPPDIVVVTIVGGSVEAAVYVRRGFEAILNAISGYYCKTLLP